MNNRDRRILERVHRCIGIPFAVVGTQSQTVRGIARFNDDMKYALPKARELLRWLACGEPYEGAIQEETEGLESWFEERNKSNWQ